MQNRDVYAARRVTELDGRFVLDAMAREVVGGTALSAELSTFDFYAVDLEPADRRRLAASGYDAVVFAVDDRGKCRHYAFRFRPPAEGEQRALF